MNKNALCGTSVLCWKSDVSSLRDLAHNLFENGCLSLSHAAFQINLESILEQVPIYLSCFGECCFAVKLQKWFVVYTILSLHIGKRRIFMSGQNVPLVSPF